MKTWKIGRYYYLEIKEEHWCEMFEYAEDKRDLYTLIDCDGEPIKYLIQVKKERIIGGSRT